MFYVKFPYSGVASLSITLSYLGHVVANIPYKSLASVLAFFDV